MKVYVERCETPGRRWFGRRATGRIRWFHWHVGPWHIGIDRGAALSDPTQEKP